MKIMTVQEAADAAGVTVSAVRMAIRRGKLRAARFGKSHAITEQDFDQWRADTRPKTRA